MTSIVSWVLFFDLGVVDALVNLVSQTHGNEDTGSMAAAISTAFFMLVGIAAALGVGLLVSVLLVRWDLVLVTKGILDLRTTAICVAAAIVPVLVSLPFSVVRQVYAGLQRAYVTNLFLVLGSFITLLGVYTAIRVSVGLPVLILTFAAGPAIASAGSFVYLFAMDLPGLAPRWRLVSSTAATGLVKLSVPLFLFQVGALLVNNTQPVIMAHTAGLGSVADYSILMRLSGAVGSFIMLGTAAFVPAFREASERGEGDWTRRAFRRMILIRVTASLIAGAAMMFGGDLFLRLWLGREDVAFGAVVWALLGVILIANSWGTAFSQLLTIMDRIWLQVGIVSLNGICTVLLTFLLTPRFGVLGALAAYGFVTLFLWSWLGPAVARRLLAAGPARSGASASVVE
jgi:O-antigen/teichoic acid export membrane protein